MSEKYVNLLFERIVAIPFSASPIIAKIGDRAIPSNLFSSRVVLTNTLLKWIKQYKRGGSTVRMKGSVTIDVHTLPITKNTPTAKSYIVKGSVSSQIPTSAENLLSILPRGLVS